jgi:MEMO1 family protein
MGGLRRAAPFALTALLAACGRPDAVATTPAAAGPRATPAVRVVPRVEGPVRPAAVAGSWYPGSAERLAREVDAMLDAAKPAKRLGGRVRALVAPHAGYAFSGATAAAAFKQVRGESRARVVLLGPSHEGAFRGVAIDRYAAYRTPLGEVPVDRAAVEALRASRSGLFAEHDGADHGEHSLEMELPMLQRALAPGFAIVPLLVGALDLDDARAIAEAIRPLADQDTLIVASGDFTHYGKNYDYLPFPPSARDLPQRLVALDDGLVAPLIALDAARMSQYRDKTRIDACGYGAFVVLADLLSPDVRGEVARHDTSGALNGDYSSSVGYVAAVFSGPTPPSLADRAIPRKEMATLLEVASRAVTRAATAAGTVDLDASRQGLEIGPRLAREGASFVTLTEGGALRGCIGSLAAREEVWRSVARNAVLAAREDDRFTPVRGDEVPKLTVEVSVLSPLRPVVSPNDLRLGDEGVVMSKAGARAVFLPEVPLEQGWDKTRWLEELGQKAGLDKNAWRSARFEAFTTQTLERPVVAR